MLFQIDSPKLKTSFKMGDLHSLFSSIEERMKYV
jgi:hypothetical protein